MAQALLTIATFLAALCAGCTQSPMRIAVIPRTCGTMMWEPEHGGVLAAALPVGGRIYWNAPTREDDVQGQIAMVERVARENFQGLILSPDHSLELITPVRRAIMRGMPTVILGSPLAIPPGGNLAYILNDEDRGGELAGERLGTILRRGGQVAIMGVDPDISGTVARSNSLEAYLEQQHPDIHVVAKTMGSFNVPHEEQVAEEVLRTTPQLDAIVCLTATATRGAISALSTSKSVRVHIISFDPDELTFEANALDSTIIENTKAMGAAAVRMIVADQNGTKMPALTKLEPVLVTRENFRSPQVEEMTSMNWQPQEMRWKWIIGP